MNHDLLYRFRFLHHFFQSRSKYDIHSPFVYKLYSEILKDKTDYPDYHTPTKKSTIRNKTLSKKDFRLLYRLSRYFKPKAILVIGADNEKSTSLLVSGSPSASLINIQDSRGVMPEPGMFDMVLVLNEQTGIDVQDYFSRIVQHIHSDSVLVFCNIHRSQQMFNAWGKIKNHSFVTLTIDLFSLGLVFCKEELSKEDFMLRY